MYRLQQKLCLRKSENLKKIKNFKCEIWNFYYHIRDAVSYLVQVEMASHQLMTSKFRTRNSRIILLYLSSIKAIDSMLLHWPLEQNVL